MTASGEGATGPTVDGYRNLTPVGAGGFSTVYRAVQVGMAREVAVKVLDVALEDERQRRTFQRECEAMGRLSRHPHIVTVFHASFSERGAPCIVMELYRTTYREQLRTRGPLSIEAILDVGVKLSGALQAVHGAGILHRDIKPHNVFISDYGEPALGDFGISSLVHEQSTSPGGGFSLDYAAPEVLDEGSDDPRSDLYALAAAMYHLASNRVPFHYEGPRAQRLNATIRRIVTEDPLPLERADAPSSLNDLLLRTMAKNLEDRPATAVDFGHELQQIQSELGLSQTNLLVSRSELSVSVPSSDDVAFDSGSDELLSGDLPSVPAGPVSVAPRRWPRTRAQMGAMMSAAATVLAVVVVLAVGTADDAGSASDPASPTGVRAARLSDNSIVVQWDGTEDGDTLRINRYGTDETQDVTASPANWNNPVASGETACFRVAHADQGEPSDDAYSVLTEAACVTPAD